MTAIHPYLLYTVAVLSLGTFQFGYNMAELNEPNEAMTCMRPIESSLSNPVPRLPDCVFRRTWEYGLATSIFAFGGLVGALASAPLGNRYGRRKTLVINTFGFIVGGLLKALATVSAVLTLGRFVSGVSSGAAAVVVPLYVNEIAPPDAKGKFGAVTQVSICVGILMTQILGLFLSKPHLWRLIFIIGGALGFLQTVLLLSLPESPRYLIARGQRSAARSALARLRGPTYGALEDEIRESEPLTNPSPSDSEAHKVTPLAFLTRRQHRKYALTVCGLMAAQQLLGINAVIFHGVPVLSSLLPEYAGVINVFISFANLAVTIAASSLFDKISHKTLLMTSMAGMSTFAFLFAASLAVKVKALSAVACLAFVMSFSFGLGPLPWMVAGRIVPYESVDAAQAAGLVVNWAGTALVGFVVPLVDKVLAFVVFGVIGVVAVGLTGWGVEKY